MKPVLFRTLSFKLAAWLGAFILAVQWVFITLVQSDQSRMIFSDLIDPLVNILAAAALFAAARHSAQNRSGETHSWYLWTIGMVFYTVGSIVWAVFDLIVGEAPFPSPATLFYVLFYLFILFGLNQYSIAENHASVKRLEYIDNGIVLLGVGLSFWVFLFRPVIAAQGFSVNSLVDLIFPGLGMASIWYIMIFFRIRVRQSSYIPLLMIAFGLFAEIVGDSLLFYQTLHKDFIGGNWLDLFYVASSISFMLAAIRHMASVEGKTGYSHAYNHPAVPQTFSGGWPVYLPYFWLAIAYALLLTGLPADRENLFLFIGIGIIIGLVVLRQVLTLTENERLYHKTQEELSERKHAEEALRQMNLELDARVALRTSDLQAANTLLLQFNQKLESSLHEKEVLLKEIHHRVKNNLQTVSSLLNLQTRLIQDPVARIALQDSQMRVRSMALIHEKLYQSESLADIQLRPYIENLASILFRSYQAESGAIQLVTRIEDLSVGIDTVVPMGLMLNELISNALKHAFPDGRAGKIQIELWRDTPQQIILQCQDDGRGLPAGVDIAMSKSLGLQLVHSLTRQLDGTVEVAGQNGLTVRIKIPHRLNLDPMEPTPTNPASQGNSM